MVVFQCSAAGLTNRFWGMLYGDAGVVGSDDSLPFRDDDAPLQRKTAPHCESTASIGRALIYIYSHAYVNVLALSSSHIYSRVLYSFPTLFGPNFPHRDPHDPVRHHHIRAHWCSELPVGCMSGYSSWHRLRENSTRSGLPDNTTLGPYNGVQKPVTTDGFSSLTSDMRFN